MIVSGERSKKGESESMQFSYYNLYKFVLLIYLTKRINSYIIYFFKRIRIKTLLFHRFSTSSRKLLRP